MTKLTRDQKRKKVLAKRIAKENLKAAKNANAQVKNNALNVIKVDKSGVKLQSCIEINEEKAELLFNEERDSNGRVYQINPDRKISLTAWEFFGVVGCNFIHSGIIECDSLIPIITPNEIDGFLVAFPDYHDKETFDTNFFMVFCEPDINFNFSDKEKVKEVEDFVHKDILPFIKSHPLIQSIDPKFVFRSYSLFRAFGKVWCSAMFYSSKKIKGYEKSISKLNIQKNYS